MHPKQCHVHLELAQYTVAWQTFQRIVSKKIRLWSKEMVLAFVFWSYLWFYSKMLAANVYILWQIFHNLHKTPTCHLYFSVDSVRLKQFYLIPIHVALVTIYLHRPNVALKAAKLVILVSKTHYFNKWNIFQQIIILFQIIHVWRLESLTKRVTKIFRIGAIAQMYDTWRQDRNDPRKKIINIAVVQKIPVIEHKIPRSDGSLQKNGILLILIHETIQNYRKYTILDYCSN